jgi:Domain of unknown function (DUF4372)
MARKLISPLIAAPAYYRNARTQAALFFATDRLRHRVHRAIFAPYEYKSRASASAVRLIGTSNSRIRSRASFHCGRAPMNTRKTPFAQVMDPLPWTTFQLIADRYHADQRVRTLSCVEQFGTMPFAQFYYRESTNERCLA